MTLFWHALRQQRLALVLWGLVLAAMDMSIAAAAEAVQSPDLGTLIESIPPALRALMGGDLILQRPLDGYINAKILAYLPLMIGIFAAFQAAAMVAREAERRHLDFVLSLPVERSRLLLARLGALLAGIAILWAVAIGVLIGGLAQKGLTGDWTGYLLSACTGFVLNAALGALALWASAGASDYRRALRTGLGITVLGYLVDLGLRIGQVDRVWRMLVLYGFYDPADLMLRHRFPAPEALVLAAVAAAAAALAVRTFGRREV